MSRTQSKKLRKDCTAVERLYAKQAGQGWQGGPEAVVRKQWRSRHNAPETLDSSGVDGAGAESPEVCCQTPRAPAYRSISPLPGRYVRGQEASRGAVARLRSRKRNNCGKRLQSAKR